MNDRVDELTDDQEERPRSMEAVFGLSEIDYPEVLERALAHANAHGVIAGQPPWICMGPRNIGGRILSLAQHPQHASILYAGSAHGGLWRTIDAGDTWENLGGRDFSVPVSAIAISEHDPNTLYVGTGALRAFHVSGRGLWRVRMERPRGVATFEQLARAPGREVAPASVQDGRALRFTRIEIDPDDPNRFWAASQTGLWRGVYNPAAPAGNRVTWTLDFPPSADAPNGAPAREAGPAPQNGFSWASYCTDLVVVRDARDTEPLDNRARYLAIYVAIDRAGVFRGRYDRESNTVTWDPERLAIGFPDGFSRVLISVCRRRPQHLYAAASLENVPTAVYRSEDHGDQWVAGKTTIPRSYLGGTQADYDLVLEVNPDNPGILLYGEIDLCLSTNSGDTFTPIIEWQNYNRGDRAQHADQHTAIFDVADRRRIWVGNDGGLATAADIRRPQGAPGYWRRRGHGITAPQFQDVATHPVLPQLTGGGLQDNANWVGFGGKTWYVIDSGDGGGMEMHAASSQVFMCTTQHSAKLTRVDTQVNAVPWLTPRVIPDVPAAVDATMFVRIRGYLTAGKGTFVENVAQDPRVPGQVMFGWITGSDVPPPPPPTAPIAYWADAAGNTNPVATPAGSGEECSALAFGPPLPATSAQTDGWIGTDAGNLFYSASAPAGAFNNAPALPQLGGLNRRISDIAVHPRDPRIVAVSSVDAAFSYQIVIIPPLGGAPVGAPGGALGVAQFGILRLKVVKDRNGNNFTLGALLPAFPATAAHVRIPGTPLILSFTGASFAVGDLWLVHPNGRVDPGTANVGPGTISGAIVTTRSPVRIIITKNGARGTSEFSWQIGAGPVTRNQPTVATFNVQGTHLVLGFSNASFANNDAWTVQPSGEVTPDAGNAGPGTLTAVARDSGRVHITYDRGLTWQDITHRDLVPAIAPAPPALPAHERQHDLDALPPGPVACLKFDVSGADYRNLALYAGTLAGVYRLENLPTPFQLAIAGPATVDVGQTVQLTANLTLHPLAVQDHTTQVDWSSSNTGFATVDAQGHVQGISAGPVVITATRGARSATHNITVTAGGAVGVPPPPPAAPMPPVTIAWKPFNNRMPLALVTDLEGVAQGRILRAATFGRGIWDCDLDGAPARRLFIRQLVTEDGREPRALVNVVITSPGALNISQFTLAIEDIPTALPARPTAASFVIPGTHLTIQFSSVNYAVNDRWTIAHTGAVTAQPGNTVPAAVTATITPRAIPALLAADPRLPPGVTGQDLTHAFDIRVDAAPFQFFDDRIDGVEFDEELGIRTPRRLERCAVYVQVHQAGIEEVPTVQVHLFFSASPPAPYAPPPGTAIPADLPPTEQFYNATFTPEPVVIRITSAVPLPRGSAEFSWKIGSEAESASLLTEATVVVPDKMTLHFSAGDYAFDDTWTITPDGVVEAAPTNTSTGSVSHGPLWRRVGTVPAIPKVTPETPVVVRFDWVPPAGVFGDNIALLALVSGNGDALPAALPAAQATIAGLIQNERRAALRIVPIAAAPVSSLYIRDGIDDDARSGNVAFVARSPDIMVPHPDVDNPATELRDLLDQRPQDHLVGNTSNRIYVRVHNAGPQATKGQVHLWAVALDDFNTPVFAPDTWTDLATPDAGAVGPPLPITVPAHGHALVHMDWAVPNHPPGEYKAYGIIALVSSDDGADPLPVTTGRVTSLDTFWKLFGEFFDSDNAALRVLRYRTP